MEIIKEETAKKFCLVAPCSITHLFIEKAQPKPCFIDCFEDPFASLIFEYKKVFQLLQLTVLEGVPENISEIGYCFEKVEREFEKLTANFLKKD